MLTAGLYILTSKLKIFPSNLIKFGMSMRLEYRWYDYEIPKVDYLVQYELPNKSKNDILLIESNIIKITKSFECDEEKIEWKIMNWKDLDKIIISYLQKNNIQFNRLIDNNIKKLKPLHNYDNKSTNRTKQLKKISGSKLIPLDYQNKIIENIKKYFTNNNNGRLYLPCGTGKTFIGFWTFKNVLKYNSVFIVVPSLYLLSETYESWQTELQFYDDKFHFILIGSDMERKEQGYLNEFKPSTDINEIKKQLNISNNIIAITTYQSSKLLLDSCKELQFKFDLGIFDEAHRSVGEANKQFTHILSDKYNICKKKLFMTATEKIFDYSIKENEEKILSMDNEKIYGKVIYIKSLRQAIEDGALVDYNIIAPFIPPENKILKDKEQINNDKISLALMILETMKKYKFTHLLIFSQMNKDAEKIIHALKKVLSYYFKDNEDVYYKYLSSNDSMKTRKIEVEKFKKAKFGIISSARIFNEGVNIKICDAICFADNKESSVDIIQCVGRCLRKYNKIPNKIGYIIIPMFCETGKNFFENSNSKTFKKIRLILKSISSTDELVSSKFKIMKCNKISNNQLPKIDILKLNDNLDLIKNSIISKIFDKNGNPYPRLRQMLINHNKVQYSKNKQLIDTKNKCINYLNEKGYKKPIIKDNNWVKWCLGNSLYEEIKNKFYKKDELYKVCIRLGIEDMLSYKNRYSTDEKLPPNEYINDGFYGLNFNLTKLLDSKAELWEI